MDAIPNMTWINRKISSKSTIFDLRDQFNSYKPIKKRYAININSFSDTRGATHTVQAHLETHNHQPTISLPGQTILTSQQNLHHPMAGLQLSTEINNVNHCSNLCYFIIYRGRCVILYILLCYLHTTRTSTLLRRQRIMRSPMYIISGIPVNWKLWSKTKQKKWQN